MGSPPVGKPLAIFLTVFNWKMYHFILNGNFFNKMVILENYPPPQKNKYLVRNSFISEVFYLIL